jgi:hypothetical protein
MTYAGAILAAFNAPDPLQNLGEHFVVSHHGSQAQGRVANLKAKQAKFILPAFVNLVWSFVNGGNVVMEDG